MKKDLYKEYRQSVDRYLPIDQVQKEMEKNTLKYVLHQYLRVRNLCDQGINDPDDVAEILNIPAYMAEDLVHEYYLIPKEFDRRSTNFSASSIINEYLVELPYLVNPVNLLKTFPDSSSLDVALYVGVYSLIWFGALRGKEYINNPPRKYPVIDDSFCFPDYYELVKNNKPTFVNSGIAGLDYAYDLIPDTRKTAWIYMFKEELKSRVDFTLKQSPDINEKYNLNPDQVEIKIWRQFPGNAKAIPNVAV